LTIRLGNSCGPACVAIMLNVDFYVVWIVCC
jgi:hypothetical protein